MYSTIWAYLWDLEEGGIEETVRLLKDDLGLDAISVATAYHSLQQLRPHRPGAKLRIENTASIYFRPESGLYHDTCMRPHVASLARQTNPLERLAKACQATGLDLISWTVCLHNSYLATTYPECAQQTVYGDNLGWILCPGVDDVRAYVIALAKDLTTNYGIKRLELETCNFGGYGHAHHHTKDGVDLGAIGSYLFSLSFSAGCVHQARERGIDVDGLRTWVRAQLDPVFAQGIPLEGGLEEFVAAREDLAAFQEMREDLVTSLIREVREATGVEVSFLLMGDRWQAGIRRPRVMEVVDLVEILAYTASPDAVEARIREVEKDLGDVSRLVVGLQAYHPAAPDGETLKANVERALALGAEQFSYYNYGIMPRPNLQWIRTCTEGSGGGNTG